MTKRERDAIHFSYQKYSKQFEKKNKLGQIREGIEKMNEYEYAAMYSQYAPLADQTLISVHELIISDSSIIEEPAIRSVQRILQENGIKVGLSVIQENPDRYFKMARSLYPSDEAYDLAISENFDW